MFFFHLFAVLCFLFSGEMDLFCAVVTSVCQTCAWHVHSADFSAIRSNSVFRWSLCSCATGGTHCYLLFVFTLFGSHAILILFSLSSCPSFLFNQSCWLVSHTLFEYKALKVNIFIELNSRNVHWQSIHSIQINAHQRRVAIAIKYFNPVWFVFFFIFSRLVTHTPIT